MAKKVLFVFSFSILLSIILIQNSFNFYVLDGYGGVHAGGYAPIITPASDYFGWDIARDICFPSFTGYYVLDGYGGIHAGGNAIPISADSYWPGRDIAKSIVCR